MVSGIIGSHVTLMGLKLLQTLGDFPVAENDHVARFLLETTLTNSRPYVF